jgi:hypothetical protein
VVLAIALFFSAHGVWNAGERYIQGRQQWHGALKQADTLKQRHRQLIRRKPDVEKLRRFVEHAEAVGLVKDRWAYYPITIDEAVTFSTAEEVLNQTAPSGAYYFKPSLLHMKKNVEKNDADRGDTDGTGKDILLTLKGSFVVRQNDR